MGSLRRSARAVQEALEAAGVESIVERLPESTRSAKEAASAIGCTVAQIAKSIVFVTKGSSRAILVIASGSNRIDESLIGSYLGEAIEKASAEQVRLATGYAIGGVPPCGHASEIEIFLDIDLFEMDQVWAAAGTPNTVFGICPRELEKLTNGTAIRIKQS